MGDSVDYVDSISAYNEGRYLQFWEFGHLFWRPLGWLSYRLFSPLTNLVFPGDERAKITVTLMAINWLAGLACVLILRSLMSRVCKREWIADVATIGFVFSAAFLNYGQTGSAYVPGIALILAAILVLVRNAERAVPSVKNALIAGLLLSAATCLWIPFVLLIPAALAAPLLLVRFDTLQIKLLFWTCVSLAVCTAISYLIVIGIINIRSMAQLEVWVTAASHGMDRMRGVPRMVFGFANSLIDLSGDGSVFKRYLKHDPLNPVSAASLIRSSLWKLIICYIVLGLMLISLLRSPRRWQFITLLVLDLLPTVIFALFIFEAGDTSRYISTLPLLFLVFGYSLSNEKSIPWIRYLSVAFIAALIFTNYSAMSYRKLQARESRNSARVNELLPLLNQNSLVLVSHLQDDLANFTRDYLFNPINRNGNLHYGAILAINTSQVDHWKRDAADGVYRVWGKGGDVWLAKRLLAPRPRVDWNWVEGDDPRVSWTDLYNYFSRFEVGQSVGGDDGFVLLLPSEHNKELLNQDASPSVNK